MLKRLVSQWVHTQAATPSIPESYQREIDKLTAELVATQRTLFEVLHERDARI